MRRLLNGLYDGAAVLAALFMIGTLLMVMASMVDRYVPLPALRGMDMYAGYCMASAGFLALAHTLVRGEHIRVTLLLHAVKGGVRRGLEMFCVVVAGVLSGALAWFSVQLVLQSREFHDVSAGLDATPLWIPQLGMAAGTVVLFVAFLDQAWQIVTGRRPVAHVADEPLRGE